MTPASSRSPRRGVQVETRAAPRYDSEVSFTSLGPWAVPAGLVLALCAGLACGDGAVSGTTTSPTGGGASDGGSVDASGTATAATGAGGGPAGTAGSSTSQGVGGGASAPKIGAHGLSYFRYGESGAATVDSPPLATQPSGSTIVVSTGRGSFGAMALPTDNKGNTPYTQLGVAHTYTNWPTSGTALYAFLGAAGGASHIVSNTNEPYDEITMAVVEVMGGGSIVDQQWVERLDSGQPVTSLPVTTTGPAVLVAFWWGDGGANEDKVAVPNNGFIVLDSIGLAGSLVQCFAAAREVEQAGTYDVTWDATPAQGAQLWLVAVQ